MSSPPNYYDLELGRKVPGTRAQSADLLRLTQTFNCIHFAGGYPVEPIDVHPSIRHLDVLFDKLTLTDKVAHAYSLGRERVEDALEMIRIAGGYTEEEFEASPRMYTNINSTSPLKHDWPMIDGCLRCIRRGQAVIVTPFTLAGAMAPVTLAGAVAQSIAEALSAIALFQFVRPGAACVLGTFTSNVDMKIRRSGLWKRPNICGPRRSRDRWRGTTACRFAHPGVVPQMSPTGRRCGRPPMPSGQRCNRGPIWSITRPVGLRAG